MDGKDLVHALEEIRRWTQNVCPCHFGEHDLYFLLPFLLLGIVPRAEIAKCMTLVVKL